MYIKTKVKCGNWGKLPYDSVILSVDDVDDVDEEGDNSRAKIKK